MINREDLLTRIEAAFPIGLLLPEEPVLKHGGECLDCSMLLPEMDQWHRVPIDRSGLALLAGEQWHLNLAGWKWFLANFLRFAVLDDSPANRLEIQSLIYFLSSSVEGVDAAIGAIDGLSLDQLVVLDEFLHWLVAHEFWEDYAGDDIASATAFVSKLILNRNGA